MFEFLKKQDKNFDVSQPNQEDLTQVAITYFIEEGDDTVKIDVGIKDYSNESIKRLGDILNIILQEKGYIETVQIIQNGFLDQGLEEEALKFLLIIAKQSKEYISDMTQDNKRSKPCISPSEML